MITDTAPQATGLNAEQGATHLYCPVCNNWEVPLYDAVTTLCGRIATAPGDGAPECPLCQHAEAEYLATGVLPCGHTEADVQASLG